MSPERISSTLTRLSVAPPSYVSTTSPPSPESLPRSSRTVRPTTALQLAAIFSMRSRSEARSGAATGTASTRVWRQPKKAGRKSSPGGSASNTAAPASTRRERNSAMERTRRSSAAKVRAFSSPFGSRNRSATRCGTAFPALSKTSASIEGRARRYHATSKSA
jgi:hypothetical protein